MNKYQRPAGGRFTDDLDSFWSNERFDDEAFDRDKSDGDTEELLKEVRQEFHVYLDDDLHQGREPSTSEEDAVKAFDDALDRLRNNIAGESSCEKCVKQKKSVRVESAESFRKGQHISMPGKMRHYSKNTHELYSLYAHHAIIKEVKIASDSRAELVLIHFTKIKGKSAIYEETNTYYLSRDEINIMHYTYPRYDADEIVKRAESQLQNQSGEDKHFRGYNPLSNNCEHFATWCVIGEKDSSQVNGLKRAIYKCLNSIRGSGLFNQCVSGILGKIVSKILFLSSDEIAFGITGAINLPGIVLGASAAIYLIYCIIKTIYYGIKYKQGKMCWSCFKEKLSSLWLSFGIYAATSVFSLVLMKIAVVLFGSGVGIPFGILLILLTCAIQWNGHKVLKALRSPFNVKTLEVLSLSNVDIGDVILLSYYGLSHEVVVTEVHEDRSSSVSGKIRGIHYGTPSLFGTREIMEDYFDVDLEKSKIRKFDCQHLLCNPKDEVIRRARKRVGETKWTIFSANRSINLCYWAKVRPRPRVSSLDLDQSVEAESGSGICSSSLVGKAEIHLMDDILLGDLVEYEHGKTGLVVALRSLDNDKGRKFEMDQIIYDKGRIVHLQTYTVNLHTDKVVVRLMHPACCHSMDKRLERAKTWLNKKGKWLFENGFFEDCILLNP